MNLSKQTGPKAHLFSFILQEAQNPERCSSSSYTDLCYDCGANNGTLCCHDCVWDDWSPWTMCMNTCGDETVSRSRLRDFGDDRCEEVGLTGCSGDTSETMDCGHPCCPGNYISTNDTLTLTLPSYDRFHCAL